METKINRCHNLESIKSVRQRKIEILQRRLDDLKSEYNYFKKRLENLLQEEDYYRAKKENRSLLLSGIICPKCGGNTITKAGRDFVCLSLINNQREKCFHHFKK